MSFLQLEGLVKRFGGAVVVDDLSLQVRKGELVALLGPSGCGKTTTLRMIAGFAPSDGGEISIDGASIDHLPSRLRGTAMVFQDYALFPHMTAFQNVAFGLRMHKVPKHEIKERVNDTLALVRLPQVGDKYPRELSGGMQQRVALARAIVLNPKILLLDEPLSNLDAKLRKQLRVELRYIHDKAGITTLFVTHDLDEAFSLADRVAVMNAGRLEQYGPPTEIYSQPATRFVADFVGHTNLLTGELNPGPSGTGDFVGRGLRVRVSHSPYESGPGVLTVPPHRIRVARADDDIDADNVFDATVRFVSFLGSSFHLILNAGETELQCDVPATAEAMKIQASDRVRVYWRADDVVYVPD